MNFLFAKQIGLKNYIFRGIKIQILKKFSETINYNTNTSLNVFYINSIINSKENYLISLFDNKIIDVFHINSLIGWNIIYCILYSIFDSNYKVDSDIFSDRIKFVKRISDRMKAISIINFIC